MRVNYNTYVISRQGRDRVGEGLPPLRFLCDVTDQPPICDSGELDRSRTAPHSRLAHRPLFNTVLRPSPRPGRNRMSRFVATHACTRDTVRGGAVATGVPHPGRRVLSRHGRVASCDTTVPDFTWHGVSRRGASGDIRAPLRRSADLGECLPERGRHQHRSPFASVATPTFSVWL